MQTNKPLNVDDLPIIIRFYQRQNIKKAYRVTYRSKGGNEDFVGAKDKNEADKRVKEIEDSGHKIINVELLKAKVYVKNPNEVPEGKKVQEGERGGHYYETGIGIESVEQTVEQKPKNLTEIYGTRNQIYEKYPGLDENFHREKVKWEYNIQHALALGELSQEEASKLGWSGKSSEKLENLPPILYHVTTAKDAVKSTGLKTRDELHQEHGAGLGGGQSDTVSFTESPEVAENIKDTLIEAYYVAYGKTTLDDLLYNAKSGEGAKQPFYDRLINYPDAKHKIEELQYNKKIQFTLGHRTEEQFNAERLKYDGSLGWKGIDEKPYIDGIGIPHYNKFARELSSDERQEELFEVYKFFLWFREAAGGKENPVFFLSDVKTLANINPEQIEILQFKPKPNAKGFRVGGLGEWRTYTGDAIELINKSIQKAKVYVKNPAEAPGGVKIG